MAADQHRDAEARTLAAFARGRIVREIERRWHLRISNKNRCRASGSVMIAAVLLTMGLASNSVAQTQIKLATMVPSGTSYHHSLQALGEKWRKDSNGAIALKIYPDGTMGGEV